MELYLLYIKYSFINSGNICVALDNYFMSHKNILGFYKNGLNLVSNPNKCQKEIKETK